MAMRQIDSCYERNNETVTKLSVPFNDLSRGVSDIREEIQTAISRVLDSGWFVMGPEHNKLEIELASYVGVKHAINVGNGTDALELALASLGIGPGKTVLTVANAGAYTTVATRALGAFPVYCDVDPETLLMSAQSLQDTLEQLEVKPDAIVVTHLYGALAPIESIVELAKKHKIPVLEDCAQSLGAKLGELMGGSFSDIATTSFYPTKNLGALGDGGAIFTNNSEHAENVKRMRQYGWGNKYSIEFANGMNSRLDELQAAILRVKLPHLDGSNTQRRKIHSEYEKGLFSSGKLLNHSDPSFIAHLAVLTVDNRANFQQHMNQLGVVTEVHYPIPDHLQIFQESKRTLKKLPVTEWASHHVVSVPMFPELTEDEVIYVTRALETA